MNKPKECLSQAAKPAGLFGRISARFMAIVHKTRADGYWLALDGAHRSGYGIRSGLHCGFNVSSGIQVGAVTHAGDADGSDGPRLRAEGVEMGEIKMFKRIIPAIILGVVVII